jgi:hypothetical protein
VAEDAGEEEESDDGSVLEEFVEGEVVKMPSDRRKRTEPLESSKTVVLEHILGMSLATGRSVMDLENFWFI